MPATMVSRILIFIGKKYHGSVKSDILPSIVQARRRNPTAGAVALPVMAFHTYGQCVFVCAAAFNKNVRGRVFICVCVCGGGAKFTRIF